MGASAPKPADPKVTAAAQTATNIRTAMANAHLQNVTQYTPDGSRTWERDLTNTIRLNDGENSYKIPTYIERVTLSPAQQAIKDGTDAAEINLANLARDQSARLQGHFENAVNYDDAPARADLSQISAPEFQDVSYAGLSSPFFASPDVADAGSVTRTYGTDFSEDRQRVEDALFNRLDSRLDRDRDALETRLANQGIQRGSELFTRSLEDFGRNVNDARTAAILGAGQEQSRLAGLEAQRAGFQNQAQAQQFGQNLGLANFGNEAAQQNTDNLYRQQATDNAGRLQFANASNDVAARGFNANIALANAQNQSRAQALTEIQALRNAPINETTALLSGSQVSMPQFNTPNLPTIPTTDFASIQANYDNQRLQAAQQKNAFTQQLIGGGLGLFGALLSDERAKKDMKKVGSLKGHTLYEYGYKGKFDDGRKHIGVSAQEVEKKRPDAVVRGPDGLRRVKYPTLFEVGRAA